MPTLKGIQRWEGNFGGDFIAILLNVQFQNGESVHSASTMLAGNPENDKMPNHTESK